MDESVARGMIEAHFDTSAITEAGGGLRDDIVRASEIYADDAVLEFPQSGERIYFGEPWEPPGWRAQWVERIEPEAPQASA